MSQVDVDAFMERVDFLSEENMVFSVPMNAVYVQNIVTTLDYIIEDILKILKAATLQSTRLDRIRKNNKLDVVPLERKYESPKLAYFSLYEVLTTLLMKVTRISNKHDGLIKALISSLQFTLVFIDEHHRVDGPALIMGMLYEIEATSLETQGYFMNVLCKEIIPLCYGVVSEENFKALDDILSIILLALECVQDVSYHFQLIETLMMFKENLWIDIMSAISFSNGSARVYATQLLFHYWPHLHCLSSSEHKLSSDSLYSAATCDNPQCRSLSSTKTATAMVIDPCYAARIADKPPPLYLCDACTPVCLGNRENLDCVGVTLPAQRITYKCENKHCLAKDSAATITLLGSKSCSTAGGGASSSRSNNQNFSWHYDNHKVRYCGECYNNLKHVIARLNLTTQMAPTSAWNSSDPAATLVIVNAVISLLTEDIKINPGTSSFDVTQKQADANVIGANNRSGIYPCKACLENVGMQSFPETLSHFGVWLLVSLCSPQQGIDQEVVSQLIAAVLIWYKNQSRFSSDDHGKRLENLKLTVLWNWLQEMQSLYFKAFLNCLLPNPPDEARVQGNWDSICPLLYHYKSGLDLLSVLGPYSIISFELWECIVPCWMMALCENVGSEDLKKLEPTLNMLFDKEMSPLGFTAEEMYNFILHSFHRVNLIHHENALEWLQMLCEVKVSMPLPMLIDMLLISNSSLQTLFSFSLNLSPSSRTNNEETTVQYSLPGLTYEESQTIVTRSCRPGVEALPSILKGMNASAAEIADDSSHDKMHSLSVTNEHKKSLSRSGSTRASKRIKAVLLKPKRSLTRRYSPRLHDDHGVEEKQEPVEKSTLPTPPHTPHRVHPKDETGNPRKLTAEWKRARVVACYVDMLDILYQQLQLQDHCDVTDQSQLVMNLLCSLMWNILKNNENRSFSKDNLSCYETVELKFTADFCELVTKLLTFVLPKQAKQAETSTEWSYFVEPIEPAPDSSITTADMHNMNPHIQLLYLLIKVMEQYNGDVVIISSIVKSISLLCINGSVFNVVETLKIDKAFDFSMFLSSLWKQLDVRCSGVLKVAVVVLFEVIDSIEGVWAHQFQLINSAFINSKQCTRDRNPSIASWNKEYETLHRIHTLLMFLSHYGADRYNRRSPVTHVAAYALALLLSVTGSKHSAIYIKAKFIIDALSVENLQIAYQCLQYEFDASLKDRTFILLLFLQLHQLRPDASPLSMARFSHFMDVLSREVKLCRGLAPIVQFARSDLSFATIPVYFRTSNAVTFDQWLRKAGLTNEIDSDFTSGYPGKRSRYSEKKSLHELCCDINDTDNEVFDPENEYREDKHTIDCIMRVMCRYMIGCGKEVGSRAQSKDEHNFIMYFRNWIGFQDKFGLITKDGAVLRKAVGVNTLLKNLPNILDSNLPLGNILLPKILCFLIVIIEMPHHSSSHPPSVGSTGHDLAILLPHDQVAWLKTLQVIMYKYTLSPDELEQLSHLLNVCMNVLMWEYHCCWSNTPHSTARDKIKKSDKAASVKPLTKTLEKLGKRFAFDVESAKHPASHSNGCADQDVDEAAFPLLMGGLSSSNRHDEAVAQSTSADASGDPSTWNNTQVQNVFLKNKIDVSSGGGNTAVDDIPKASKNGADREEGHSNILLATSECKRCKTTKREYSIQTICLSIANLCQFVRVHPTAAVKLLPQFLSQLAYIAEPLCEEQSSESSQCTSTQTDIVFVAKQSIRCVLHHLADSRIFSALFSMSFSKESSFLRVLIVCLRDYHVFHSAGVLQRTLEDLPDDFKRPDINVLCLLSNMSTYLQHLHDETVLNINWQYLANLFSAFFLKLHTYMVEEGLKQIDDVLLLMLNLLRAPVLGHTKFVLLEPYCKIIGTSVSKFNFSSKLLYDLCEAGYELFAKDKDKLHLSRCVVSKLLSALKMNATETNQNILHLLQVVLLDGGSRVNSLSSCDHVNEKIVLKKRCYAMECVRNHLSEFLDILSDSSFFPNPNNVDGLKPGQVGFCLHETQQLKLKLAVGQLVAAHLHAHFNYTYNSSTSTNSHLIQSLFQPPPAMQHGQKQHSECMSQIKKISWVLLGALSHLGLEQGSADNIWLPVPFSVASKLSVSLQVILTGCLDHTKETNANLTSLFYVFIFCQLWTVYCEQLSYFTPSTDLPVNFTCYNPVGQNSRAGKILFAFWSRLTPSILILLQDGKDPQVLASIHRHIESLMECLQVYDSSVLNKLSTLWSPMLNDNLNQEKTSVGNHSYHPRDPPEVSNSSSTCGFLNKRGLDCGSDGLIENAAQLNAKRVLVIVERINRKLVDFERNSLSVI